MTKSVDPIDEVPSAFPDFTPRGTYHRVRVTDPLRQTPGGIYIPEVAQTMPSEGTVLASGPGLWVESLGQHTPMQVAVGEEVLFQKHDLTSIPGTEREALIKDEDLVGIIYPDGAEVEPANDWLLVAMEEEIDRLGSFIIPERYRKRPRFGTVRAFGLGKLLKRGGHYGTRKPCPIIMSLDHNESPVGLRVYWDLHAATLRFWIGGEALMFVRAGDVIAAEGENHA